MAGTASVSEFFKRNAAQVEKAVKEHSSKELKSGGGFGLPVGINGVARLMKVELVPNDDGSMEWKALAEMDSPEYAKSGEYIKGMKSQKSFTITEADLMKNLEQPTQILRRLAGHDLFNSLHGKSFPDVVAFINESNKQKPIYFRLNTSMGKASGAIDPKTGEPYPPRVSEWWNDALPGYVPGTKSAAPSTNGTHANGKGEGGPAWTERNTPVEPTKYREDMDIGSLLARSRKTEGGDTEAYDALREACTKKGWTEEEFDSAGWDDIEEYLAGKDEEKPAETAVKVPVAGETECKFAPPDPKKPGKRLKPVDCAVTAVKTKGKTMTLKNLETKKEYADIAWDDENVEYADE
jgi:hypothetical protein